MSCQNRITCISFGVCKHSSYIFRLSCIILFKCIPNVPSLHALSIVKTNLVYIYIITHFVIEFNV